MAVPSILNDDDPAIPFSFGVTLFRREVLGGKYFLFNACLTFNHSPPCDF